LSTVPTQIRIDSVSKSRRTNSLMNYTQTGRYLLTKYLPVRKSSIISTFWMLVPGTNISSFTLDVPGEVLPIFDPVRG
jgi:hypothetical protein